MNLREVREAAEYVQGIIAGWEHHPDLASEPREIIDGWRSKLLMQSTHILAIIDPSPDEPITADWLREVWGAEELNDGVVQARILFSSHPPYIGSVELGRDAILICETPTAITTRQQFCDLARCLGISRKQPKPEPEGCTSAWLFASNSLPASWTFSGGQTSHL